MRREPFFTSSRSPPLLHFIIEQFTHIPINFNSTVHRYYFHKSNSALNNPRCDNDPMISRPQKNFRFNEKYCTMLPWNWNSSIQRANHPVSITAPQWVVTEPWWRGPQTPVIAELFSSRLFNSLLPARWCTFKLPVLSLRALVLEECVKRENSIDWLKEIQRVECLVPLLEFSYLLIAELNTWCDD